MKVLDLGLTHTERRIFQIEVLMRKAFVMPIVLFCMMLLFAYTYFDIVIVWQAPITGIVLFPLNILLFFGFRNVVVSGAAYLDGP
jgi:hypothetical protein